MLYGRVLKNKKVINEMDNAELAPDELPPLLEEETNSLDSNNSNTSNQHNKEATPVYLAQANQPAALASQSTASTATIAVLQGHVSSERDIGSSDDGGFEESAEKNTVLNKSRIENTVLVKPANTHMISSYHRKKLYFGELVEKLRNQELKQDAEVEILSSASSQIISTMKMQLKREKQALALAEVEAKIIDVAEPLKLLEEEWRTLRHEADLKTRLLKKNEDEIKRRAEELRELFQKKNSIIKKFNEKNNNSHTKQKSQKQKSHAKVNPSVSKR
jgi:hypothetical protein